MSKSRDFSKVGIDTIVSSTSLKTVNSQTLLGGGNLSVGDVTATGAQSLTNKDFNTVSLSGNVKEKVTISATSSTGTIAYDVLSQQVLYYTSSATANFTINARGNSTTTLNSLLNVGDSITVVFLNTNGGTAYYATGFQVDGVAVTPRWSGSAPTAGSASAIDLYTYTIIKTANAVFTVFASVSKYV